jgi:excinuclease UvrABC nuclease subunit
MARSRPRELNAQNVSQVPAQPGVYVLIGTRGIVNYVGSGTDLRARLLDVLSTGRVPATRFQYEVIHDASKRAATEQSLVQEHMPRYNAA